LSLLARREPRNELKTKANLFHLAIDVTELGRDPGLLCKLS
jgi:hypothetical protein